MQKIFSKQLTLYVLLATMSLPALSQDSTSTAKRPKDFNTFSIGVNAGVLAPISPLGGSNDFTKWKPTFGYGLYIKNQFTHYLAVQAEFLRGTLQGNNDNTLGNGQPTTNPYESFKTELNWAASISGVVTFGNINWLSDKSTIIPYVSVGGGLAGYKPVLNEGTGSEIDYKTDGKNIQEFFVPVGAGLKIAAAPNLNIDLGYRMNYVDGDNLDGYSNGSTKDKFSYGFAGLEFAVGGKGKKQLMMDNPVADFKRDLMDENNALRASVTASQQQSASEIDSLQNEVNRLKTDSDNDGVADYLDKCPGTADTVKVDGSGCPLPKLTPPPPPPAVVITAEDRRVVDEAIKDLQFDFGKATIRSVSYPSLDRVAAILVNKNFSLKLAGHTDNVGSDAANMKLSKDRAESVKAYLVSKGANASRIEATGYGETQPITSNKTEAGRQKNRRVEFTLY